MKRNAASNGCLAIVDPMRHGALTGALVLALSVLAISFAFAVPAQAEESASTGPALGSIVVNVVPAKEEPESKAPSTNRFMEEIVVTAQKREEAIQDVPIAIQAFSAEALDARGVSSVQDLQTVTPGLVITQVSTLTNVYLRGVGSDAFIPSADPSVGLYIDGIYQPFSPAAAQNFGSVKRVEVLKGPQGTLFGRNSTGGAINIITEDPEDYFQASASLGLESYDTSRFKAAVSGPVVDTLSASLSLLYNHGDSYYGFTPDSPVQDFRYGEQDLGARLKVKWMPTESFDLTLTGFTLRSKGGTAGVSVQDAPSPAGGLLGVSKQTDPRYKANTDIDPILKLENEMVYLQGNWRPGWLDVKLLASDQRSEIDTNTDYDGTAVPLVSFTTERTVGGDRGLYSYTKTAELQLISNEESSMSGALKWIVGLYYIDGDQGFGPIYLDAGGITDPLSSVFRNPLPLLGSPTLLDLLPIPGLDAALDNIPIDAGGRVQIHGQLSTESYAAYTQATYDFSDWMALTLGARYTVENRDLYRSDVNLALNSGAVVPVIAFNPDSKRQENFSPKATIDFKPMQDVLLYASAQKGFKSGTFNSVNVVNPPKFVKPETLIAYELGAKTDWFERQVRLNLAAFQNRIDDLQVQFISLISGGVTNLENAAKAEITGAEYDLSWSITPSLVFTSAGTYLHAVYKDYPNARGYDKQTGVYFANGDFSGNRITRTPKTAIQAGLSYTFELARGSLETAVDVNHNSGYFFDAQNVTTQPSYTKFDARLSYYYEPRKIRVTAFGQNLTDAKIYGFKYLTDFGVISRLSPPSIYGIRVNWDF